MYKRGIKILFPFLIIIVISLLVAGNTTTKDDLYDNDPPKLGYLNAEYYAQLGITEDVEPMH